MTVRRERRLPPGELAPYLLAAPDPPAPLDFRAVFGNANPVEVEVGFGKGLFLLSSARARSDVNFLGIEIVRKYQLFTATRLAKRGLGNVRVACADAVEVLREMIAPASLDGAHIFFPDPWPKKRHHKRRLVQADFIELIQRALTAGGYFHLATDWQEYAEHMLALLGQTPGFENAAGAGRYAPRPEYRPLTKFERRGQRLGHGVWDLIFRKNERPG